MGQSMKELLKFQGQWRNYQQRVLDRMDRYIADKKIHIVAAPGSGKTTLGIELIRRMDAPALVLAPSINIRDQWINRIKDAFLPEGTNLEGIVSNCIKTPALITVITYQSLHSAIRGVKNNNDLYRTEEEEDEIVQLAENEDYSEFDLFQMIKKQRIGTICLDEAHHLRSEWWKALQELLERSGDVTLISLTATPPYDASKAEWERYESLSGMIDEEIIVPELVKEGSLCPHQDYVYFSKPTKEEERVVVKFQQEAEAVASEILADKQFADYVSHHAGILHPSQHMEQLLEKPEYLSSILVFLNEKKIPFSKDLIKMLGAKGKVPNMNLTWLGILLQGFLYNDIESYDADRVYREELITKLKSHGMIQRNKVVLNVKDGISKLLQTSKSKIKSITAIVGAEYKSLGEGLRLLILTDYIKKEYMQALGDTRKQVNEQGVVPIFENIRREYEKNGYEKELRIAALSGSVVIIPESALVPLERISVEKGVQVSTKECGARGYYQVSVKGNKETASSIVTELFNQGEIRVLIGTKALLGEGWDSPCINSLILASFVGSYMLSNQMRGRAIRAMYGNPNKVSNIWHLVCMEPDRMKSDQMEKQSSGLTIEEESDDFITLKRRFEAFLGVSYYEDLIQNGLERLSIIHPPYHRRNLNTINHEMLNLAADRDGLRRRWNSSLDVVRDMDVAIEAGGDNELFKPGVLFFNALLLAAISGFFMVVVIGLELLLLNGQLANQARADSVSIVLLVAGLLGFLITIWEVGVALRFSTPMRNLKQIGKGMLTALQEQGMITSKDTAVKAEGKQGLYSYVHLIGGTEREKAVFANCIMELFGNVDNQRYLLKAKGRVPKLCKYYSVPELFAKKKEDAMRFQSCMKKQIGYYELVYTRNPEGRKVLLDARIHSLANKYEKKMNKKKKVKGEFE